MSRETIQKEEEFNFMFMSPSFRGLPLSEAT
jgi:hypothetical protein